MKVLSIGTDRNIFKEDEARGRQTEYGRLFDELHIIVFSRRKLGLKAQKISENTWIYPTGSLSRLTYVYGAKKIGEKILGNDRKSDWAITSQDPFETGLVASHLSLISGTRLNIQVHTNFLDEHFKRLSFLNRFRVPQAIRFIENANSVRVVSEQIKNSLISINPKSKNLSSKISVLPMFTDIEKIYQTEPQFDLHRKYPEFNFIILSVARLEYEKNFSFGLKVFSRILKKFPKVGYVIVGEGREKIKLEKLAKRLDIESNIKFEGHQEDTISYYKTADLYLNTSFFEGYSRSLIESAAARCSILSTRVGPIDEVLITEKDVLTCSSSDEDCFVEKIERLISDDNFRQSLSKNAFEAVKNKAISKEEYLDRYRKAIIGY